MNHHPDDDEGYSPRLWDATPGVCCAAYQLGACSHTESYDERYDEYDDEPDNSDEAIEARRAMFSGFGWGVTR